MTTVDFLLSVAFGAFVLFVIYRIVRAIYKTNEAYQLRFKNLKAINDKLGTKFPTSGKDKYALQMGHHHWTCLFFDAEKKVVVLAHSDGTCEVKPWDFIKTWQLLWTERNGSIVKIRFEIGTAELDRPLIYVPMTEYADANAWDRKLSILFGES